MPIVDIHTHVYTPEYMSLLRSRSKVPYVRTFPPDTTSRLVILPGEDDPSNPSTSRGRPISEEYFDISRKIAFMDNHGIDISVISLANPWLDFLEPEESEDAAKRLNDELDQICQKSQGRLFAFGALPLSASIGVIVREVQRLATLKFMRGVIVGTGGIGKGLDDLALEPVYEALQESGLIIFLHPHYGLPKEVFGPRASEYGHVLPLALGFPLETTIAMSRMILSGIWDRWTKLTVLVAHSGGTLPFLAGRLESCIQHDGHLHDIDQGNKRRNVWDILRNNILLDAVVYSELGVKAAIEASGADRVMFGTDHPFFPPLTSDDPNPQWLSVTSNYKAIRDSFKGNEEAVEDVLGCNAIKMLKLFTREDVKSQ